MKKIAWFSFFLIMAVSCLDEPDCFRQNVNLVGITFKKMFDGAGDTVYIEKITSDATSKIFIDSTLAPNITLPLNYLANGTNYTFSQQVDGVIETYKLLLTHKSKVQFVSEDCGQRYIVSDLAITDSDPDFAFDSVRLVSTSPSASNPAGVNIEIYRCPRYNIMRFSFRQLFMDTVKLGQPDARHIITIDNALQTLYPNTTLSSVLLRLDPLATAATFNFKLDDGESRAISLSYLVKDTIILEKCGSQKVIFNLDTTKTANDFPILVIANNAISDPPHTNIIAYRCPSTDSIRVTFRRQKGSSPVADLLDLKSLVSDINATPIYTNTLVSSVILPLNENADTTRYTFIIGDKTETLTLSYVNTPTEFHKVCGVQPVFTDIKIVETTFVTVKRTVLDPKAKFPITNNIEIHR